jgi:hypothetical protein
MQVLAAGEHGLSRLLASWRLGSAGADHGVQLVDEQDHLTDDSAPFEHRLSRSSNSPRTGTGDQRAHVERPAGDL